jgi:hypothetical protein
MCPTDHCGASAVDCRRRRQKQVRQPDDVIHATIIGRVRVRTYQGIAAGVLSTTPDVSSLSGERGVGIVRGQEAAGGYQKYQPSCAEPLMMQVVRPDDERSQ